MAESVFQSEFEAFEDIRTKKESSPFGELPCSEWRLDV